WQSAILSRLVGRGKVYSIDKDHDLIKFAKENHKKAGIKNVEIIEGDGSIGIDEKSPFDRIIITAACPAVPKPLEKQLADNGLLVAPVGKGTQSMVLYRKEKGKMKEIRREEGYVFVPLLGKYGFK
ncbi:MAG: methyltransferase domain-containing protein, partial [Candidatus Aenigmarchaeota archaeon]|nr:methyltransferase domain-containing protein [Candidatus Aenigmarchaeota archaeon]